MPYITSKRRDEIFRDAGLSLLEVLDEINTGEKLDYVVAHFVWAYLNKRIENCNGHNALQKLSQDLWQYLVRQIPQVKLQLHCDDIGRCLYDVAGEFNYIITLLLHQSLMDIGVRYAHLNHLVGMIERILVDLASCVEEKQSADHAILDDVYGMLRCVQLEMYRVLAAPYEDEKMEENGQISDLDDGFLDARLRLHKLLYPQESQ